MSGYLIFAPCGSGKTRWINNSESLRVHDGDEILARGGVKNKNYFWYDPKYKQECDKIAEVFARYLNRGYNILYSGHPGILTPNYLVIPDKETRWRRLVTRAESGGWCPTRQQFETEESIYRDFSATIPTFNSFEECDKLRP